MQGASCLSLKVVDTDAYHQRAHALPAEAFGEGEPTAASDGRQAMLRRPRQRLSSWCFSSKSDLLRETDPEARLLSW